MAGTIKHRHQSTVPPGGGDIRSTEWNDSLVMSGGTNGQFAMRDSTQADGWRWAATYTPTAPTLSAISTAAQPATLNPSTVGLVDWLVMPAVQIPRTLSTGAHFKAKGGWLMHGFDWVFSASAGLATFANSMAVTTNSGDDISAALSGSTTACLISDSTGGALNYGWSLRFPCSTTLRTMQIYAGVFSGSLTLTAGLSSGAVANQSTTLAQGPGTSSQNLFSFTFNDNEGWLWVTALLTVNQGSTPNVRFHAALVS
jgi:hypothetical protein